MLDQRSTPISNPLAAVAYHEAGHAVMAHLCGQRLTRVEVIGDEVQAGSVSSLRLHDEPEMGDDPAVRTAPLEARILCVCAGIACEGMVTGEVVWDESSEDINMAVRLAMKVLGDCEKVMPYLEQARDHAEDLLRRHWDAVEELALALMDRGSMSGEEVRALLRPLLPPS